MVDTAVPCLAVYLWGRLPELLVRAPQDSQDLLK